MNQAKGHIGTFGSLLVRAVIGLAFFAILLSLPRTASAVLITQCPAIGGDTGCGILITINADGSVTVTTATAPTQPPYDGVEDTLIGVQNNTTLTSIPNITVSSGATIFGLDGDGLCAVTPHPAGCPFGSTGYEGPNTTFTGINAAQTSGTVNFIGGIPPGGSAYFSLEEPLNAASISVSVELAISATAVPVAATEGAAFSGAVATFVDPDTTAVATDYSATIDWGDSSTSSGTISGSPTNSPFTVSGSHTYAEEGTYTVTVTINDVDNPLNTATATTTATVADAALNSACTVPSTTPQSFSGSTATFTDSDPSGTVSDFTATIDWGDSSTSTGSITGPVTGAFTVSGSHTYASTGFFVVSTTITDAGGSTTTATCNRTAVFAFAPGGGSFVIGDKESALTTPVNFWGAQWSKNNPTTSASQVPSFKGFAESPVTPSCGTTWSTDPGNSTPPPAGPLPALMGVLVTNHYAKSGSQISGDTPAIVVVQTNSGYQPNPGHPGTGTVVGQFCRQ